MTYLNGFLVGVYNKIGLLNTTFPTWKRFCFEFNTEDKQIKCRVEEALVGTIKNVTFPDLSTITRFWTNWDIFSDFNVFSLEAFRRSKDTTLGDIYSWRPADWIHPDKWIRHKKVMNVSRRIVNSPRYLLFNPKAMSYTMAKTLCWKLGRGRLSDIHSENYANDWDHSVRKTLNSELHVWLNYDKKEMAGLQCSVPNCTFPWAPSQPNNVEQECLVCDRELCSDVFCEEHYNAICMYDETPIFRLKGLCRNTNLDTIYFPRTIGDGIVYVGPKGTVIRYNPSTYVWEMRHISGKVWALSYSPHHTYLMGTSTWLIHNDDCYGSVAPPVNVSLTVCQDNEFNCDNGECTGLVNRCDGKNDCPDASEELNCAFIDTSLSAYNCKIHPSNSHQDGNNVTVEVSIRIESIINIFERLGQVRLKLVEILEWYDHRLTYTNLWTNGQNNLLSDYEFYYVWKPATDYWNLQEKDLEIHTGPDINIEPDIIASRDGTVFSQKRERLYHARFQSGKHGKLRQTKRFSGYFYCTFKMKNYPFDVQTCSVHMALQKHQRYSVRLKPREVILVAKRTIGDISLLDYKICSFLLKPYGELVIMSMTFGRNIMSVVLTVFIPTLISIMISSLTTYFQLEYFDIAIGVNLTLMLVITTMFVSVSQSLPASCDVKLVEIWMLFSLLMPFVEVVLQTLHYILRTKEKISKRCLRILSVVQKQIKPTLIVLFTIGFYIYGNLVKHSDSPLERESMDYLYIHCHDNMTEREISLT